MKVYLAGPINGCTDDQCVTWREFVKAAIGEDQCVDPMRRDYRGREAECVDEIVEGDKDDIRRSALMLANCWQVSWGTAMEIAYAFSQFIPVIAVVPPGARVSPWLAYHAQVVTGLTEALGLIEAWRECLPRS